MADLQSSTPEIEAVKQQLPADCSHWREGASLARCVEDLRMDRDRLRQALVKVRAHTSYVSPNWKLLKGLLASIERITDEALR